MAAPKYDVCQWNVQNPDATALLHIPIVVLCNTPDEDIEANIRANTERDLLWLEGQPAHSGVAILVGGGASVADQLDKIRWLVDQGGTVFAMNAASQYLRGKGIAVDWQVTCDAKPETAGLVDPCAGGHLFASHVNPATMQAARAPMVWHSALHCNEDWFPPHKKKRGGYALLGGEASTGLGALCVAYCMGFRRLEIFGYDSSHKDNQSHAYRQKMNDTIPVMEYSWAGRTFKTSVTMRTQAERFPITANALIEAGATLNVWGDGLLQHIWHAPPEALEERDKYVRMWQIESYREHSPGEVAVPTFLEHLPQDDAPRTIIDFGCGTGRAGLALARAGFEVTLMDFVSGCRDQEAMELPFIEWDLTKPYPIRAPYGYCCDVMEHIREQDVEAVITNILKATKYAFFQISTHADGFGILIHQELHVTVQPAAWWRSMMEACGGKILWANERNGEVQLLVS